MSKYYLPKQKKLTLKSLTKPIRNGRKLRIPPVLEIHPRTLKVYVRVGQWLGEEYVRDEVLVDVDELAFTEIVRPYILALSEDQWTELSELLLSNTNTDLLVTTH